MIEIGDYIEFDNSKLVLKRLKNDQVLVIISPDNNTNIGYIFFCTIKVIINEGGTKVTDKNKINIYNKLEIFQ